MPMRTNSTSERFKNRKEALVWLQSRGQISTGKFYQDCGAGYLTILPDKTLSKFQVAEYADKVFGFARQETPLKEIQNIRTCRSSKTSASVAGLPEQIKNITTKLTRVQKHKQYKDYCNLVLAEFKALQFQLWQRTGVMNRASKHIQQTIRDVKKYGYSGNSKRYMESDIAMLFETVADLKTISESVSCLIANMTSEIGNHEFD